MAFSFGEIFSLSLGRFFERFARSGMIGFHSHSFLFLFYPTIHPTDKNENPRPCR